MKRLITHMILTVSVLLYTTTVTSRDESAAPADNPVEEIPFDEIRTFTEVFAKVKNDYVEQISDKELLENAIRGMLAGLDPHSAYLDPEAYRNLQEGTTGEFGGLGIEVSMEDGFVKVIAPIDDTPAQRAGIRTGDLIVRLDETPVKGLTLDEAVELMRGKPGTDIMLTIIREGEEKPLTITLIRDTITRKSASTRLLEPGYGYLRISNFQTNTAIDAQAELEKLKNETRGGLKGLILDLRNNPGGILSGAVAISDLFLEEGLIVYTEGRGNDSRLKFDAKPVDVLNHAPLIVLVNAGSASASEIVAGALQDHKRAIIMGQRTFGKGSVQTILPMTNEAALKLTTARYYTPSGRSIQAEGINPDIIIDQVKIEKIEINTFAVNEANLNRHLENKESTTAETAPGTREESKPLIQSDYALYEALNVLKGMVLQQKKSG